MRGAGEAFVHRADEVELLALHVLRLTRADIRDGFGFIGLHDAGLMLCGQEAIAEQTHAAMRSGRAAALQHDVAGQITRLGAEAVARPRSRAGEAEEGKAGVHEEVPLRMLAELRGHAADHAEVIRHAADLWEEIAHLKARLPVAFEVPMRGLNGSVVVELRLLHRARHRLALELLEHRLVIERIDMRHPAAHVEEDDAACFGCKALGSTHECGLGFFLHEASESGHAEAGGSAGEEVATGKSGVHQRVN